MCMYIYTHTYARPHYLLSVAALQIERMRFSLMVGFLGTIENGDLNCAI